MSPRPVKPRLPANRHRITTRATIADLLNAIAVGQVSHSRTSDTIKAHLMRIGDLAGFADECAHLNVNTYGHTYRFAYRRDMLENSYRSTCGQLVYRPEWNPWQVMSITVTAGSLTNPLTARLKVNVQHRRGDHTPASFGTADIARDNYRFLIG